MVRICNNCDHWTTKYIFPKNSTEKIVYGRCWENSYYVTNTFSCLNWKRLKEVKTPTEQ